MDLSILLSLDTWTSAGRDEQDRIAREVARRLPRAFEYLGLSASERSVARFAHPTGTFALLPGVRNLALGYAPELLVIDDVACAAIAREIEVFREEPLEQHLLAFRDELRSETSPRRQVSLGPLLIAEVAEHRDERTTAARLEQELAPAGFRLPTENEWEYACGAGRDGYFKWGVRMPCEAQPPGGGGFDGEEVFEEAVRPNAFGLRIAHDPYQWEFCHTLGVMRGGDGGTAWCGGEGTLAIWRALGTPYRCVQRPEEIINPFTQKPQWVEAEAKGYVRRVVSVAGA